MTVSDDITFRQNKDLPLEQTLRLYRAHNWSSAQKPEQLRLGLLHSHTVISAWHEEVLVGLGNAVSDGHLVVYYPHLLVLPHYQKAGIGRAILQRLQQKYESFHQQVVLADAKAVVFYEKCGFTLARGTLGMWIYKGDDH